MKSAIRNLVFLSVFLFSVSYDCLVTGVSYDKEHKLYPEISGDCLPVYEYGHRWMRLGFASFGGGSVIIIMMLYVLLRKEKRPQIPSISIKGN